MKKTFIFIFAIVLAIAVKAQDSKGFYSFDKIDNTVELNIKKIRLFEQRVHLMYLLHNDGRFDISESGKSGFFVIKRNENSYNFNLEDTFNSFYNDAETSFSNMSKEEIGQQYIGWKTSLPKNIVSSLMMDLYVKDRENDHCATADPFCTDVGVYHFPAGTDSGSGESGPDYDCLYTTPNPAWYYMRMGIPGSMSIHMFSTPSYDIDFCCWGPFSDPESPCPNGLVDSKVVSCSYSALHEETCVIPNTAQTGEYYILVITNYSNKECDITFSKTSGSGTTDCSIMPPLVANDGPYCVGQTIHLDGHAQSGAVYNWSGPGGWTATGQTVTRPNCTLAMRGTYTCTISLNGQTSSADTEVEVYANPVASFSANTVCFGNQTVFVSNSTTNPPGQPITRYLWEFGDGNTSTQQNPRHTYAAAGTYQAKLTVACGDNACTNFVTRTVTVTEMPHAYAGENQSVYHGDSATLEAEEVSGASYEWQPQSKINGSNTTRIVHTKPLETSTTFTVTVSKNGCSSNDDVIVVVGAMMTAEIEIADSEVCQNDTTTLTATAVGGNPFNYTFSWEPANEVQDPDAAQTLAFPSLSTDHFTCTISDGNTTVVRTVNVTVRPMPNADAGQDQNIFYDNSTVLEAAYIDDYTEYSWQPADSIVGYSNGRIVNTKALKGTTVFTVTVTDSHGCESHDSMVVNVGPKMTASATIQDPVICEGETTWVTATAEGGNPSTYSFAWEPANEVEYPNSATTQVFPSTDTEFFTCTISDGHTTVAKVVYITVNPLPIADAGNDTVVNYDNPAYLKAAFVDEATYEWLPKDKILNQDNEHQEVTTIPLRERTDFTLRVTRQDCTTEDIVTVFAGNELQGNVTTDVNSTSICIYDGTAELTANVYGGNGISTYTYSWSSSKPGEFSSLDTRTTVFSNPTESGEYIITCTVNDGQNTIECTKLINVNPQPVAEVSVVDAVIINEYPSVVIGESLTLEAEYVEGASYLWQSDDPIANTMENGRIVTTYPFNSVGFHDFSVTVKKKTETNNFCTNTTTIRVKVYESVSTTLQASSDAVCERETVTLTATPSGGTGEYSYIWEPAEYFENNTGQTVTSKKLPGGYGMIRFTCRVSDLYLDNASYEKEIPIIIHDGPSVNYNLLGESLVEPGDEFYPYVYEYNIDSQSLSGYNIDDATFTWTIKSEYNTPNQIDPETQESSWGIYVPGENSKKVYVYVNEEGNAKLICTINTECGTTLARKIIYTNGFDYDDVFVEEVSYDDIISIYPNPTNGKLHISYGDIALSMPVTVSVYSCSGLLICQKEDSTSNKVMNLSMAEMSNGLYFVRITGKDFVVTKKFVLNK